MMTVRYPFQATIISGYVAEADPAGRRAERTEQE
jgi:hypothetical protein